MSINPALKGIASSPELVVLVDCQHRIIARNPAAARFELSAHGHDAVARALATRESQAFDWCEDMSSGQRTWFSATACPLERDGHLTGTIVTARDITMVKCPDAQARRGNQLLVDAQGVAHLGTWEWDVEQTTVTWSEELYRIYGVTPTEYSPSYEGYLSKIHPEDRQSVVEATERLFHERVPYSHDARVLRPDGSIRYLHSWAYPVHDRDGNLVRLIGVCQDITDRAEAELKLYQLNAELELRVADRTRQLEAVLHDLEAFNGMVSHDLRAPLAVIQMATDVLEEQPDLPPKASLVLARIQRAVDTMSGLLDDLLIFARVGEGALHPIDIDVSALSAELVIEQRLAAPNRLVDVRIEPGLHAVADPSLFRAALANLIGNAWKYTGRVDTAHIEIGAAYRIDGHALYVRDNGIGFDMAERDKLFTPFVRLGNARDFSGTGVGLATVQRIVARHGGRVQAEGSPGLGATFFLYLPERPDVAEPVVEHL